MAPFSLQQHPLLLDSVFSPNSPLKNSGLLDEFLPNFNQFFFTSMHPYLSLPYLDGSSIDASNQESSCLEQQSISNTDQKQGSQSLLTMVAKAESGEQVTQVCSPVDKKRKTRNGSSSNSADSKDIKQAKAKKQKGDKEAKKDNRNDKKDQNKANVEEPPKGYIHVRARRGQATDSHSLAERVRRERISERMKMLQALVPGCDKVTGKALMLDEIINYVQSLQNQVEFLSMRLASLDPMVYTFGLMDVDPTMPFGTQGIIDNNGMALAMQSSTAVATATITAGMGTAPSNCLIDPTAVAASVSHNTVVSTTQSSSSPNINTTPAATNANTGAIFNRLPNYINANAITTVATAAFPGPLVIDGSANLFQPEQKPSVLPLQDDRSLYMGSGVDDRLSFFNQFGFSASN